MSEVEALRQELAARPEPSGREEQTAATVAAWLEARGVDVWTGIGGHGVLARVGGPGEESGDAPGPVRLLRAELDAVPAAGGSGHHCGHDGHMAMLCQALVEMAEAEPPHPVVALFQPAEETGEGMARCLDDAAMRALDVRDCFAIHNIPGEPLGAVILGPGALASDGLRIRFEGRSSHAAEPEEGVSPWPAMRDAADAIADHVTGDPRATLIHVRLGEEAYGTSPGTGVVAATLRGSSLADVRGLAKRLCPAGGRVDVTCEDVDPFPETRNDLRLVTALADAAASAGMDVLRREEPWPWSEDFGHATAAWPGVLVGLGSGADQPPLHDSRHVFPDALLAHGVRLWRAIGGLP